MKGKNKMRTKTPIKSIREHCIECSSGSKSEVFKCSLVDCPLYPYRLGKNPNRKGIGGKFQNVKLS